MIKAYGIPVSEPIVGGSSTPPHYGRTDYDHRWGVNTLRGSIAPGGTVSALADVAGTDGLARSGAGPITLADDGGRNPHTAHSSSPTATAWMQVSIAGASTTHTTFWCVNLSSGLSQAIRTPGRVYGTTGGGLLNAFGSGVVTTTANVVGWKVIAITSTPAGFSVWVNGVKDGDYTGAAGTQSVYGMAPTGTASWSFGEDITFPSVLPDADLAAISKAMMTERGVV